MPFSTSPGDFESVLKPLWLRAQSGDEVAYRQCLGMLAARLRGYLKRRLSGLPDEVEDLVQETLLALHLQRGTYDPSLPVSAWTMAIARHKLVDLWRRRGRRDDLHDDVDEQMLAAASNYLVEQKFDLKALMRVILQSETYQRSSATLSENAGDQRQYSRYFPRRLMAEVLLDAVSQVTDVPTDFTKIVFLGSDVKDTKDYPKGTRAIQLHDSAVQSYFLQTFGRNQRRITCECERSDEPSLVQVLHISNGDTINPKLSAPGNRLTKWLAEIKSDPELLDEIFLTSVARLPSTREKDEILPLLASASAEEKRIVLEDLVWSVLSSREFLFNH